MDTPQKDDPIKVDLEKGSSKNFEIRTMADDLAQGTKEMPGAQPPPSSVFMPPPSPTPLPEPPASVIMPTPEQSAPPSPTPSAAPQGAPSGLMFDDEPSSGGGWIKSFLMGFILVLLLGVIGIGSWWWYTSKLAGIDTTPTTPTIIPPVVLKVIPTDKNINFPLDATDGQTGFFDKLSSLLSSSLEGLTPLQVVGVDVTKNDTKLSLNELGALAGIDMAAYAFGEEYQLVFAAPQGAPVLGIAIALPKNQATKDALLAKEREFPALANTMYSAYTKNALPQAASDGFLENIYQGVTIRYMNFDMPDRALDYAVVNDILLVTGSREMIFTLIDKVQANDEMPEKETQLTS